MDLIDLETLKNAPLTVVGRLVDASNATLFATINIGTNEEIPVVYKPKAGERPLWDFPHETLANREVAAYEISELLGFRCVPPTVLREGPYGIGAVQQWIDVDESADVIEIGQSDLPQIRSLALFDAVINNTDRKFGHILVTSAEEIFGCDHGVSFHTEDKLRTVIWQFAGKELDLNERNALQKSSEELSRRGMLEPLLSTKEIEALLGRIERLLTENQFPFPSDEWPAIPWPPV